MGSEMCIRDSLSGNNAGLVNVAVEEKRELVGNLANGGVVNGGAANGGVANNVVGEVTGLVGVGLKERKVIDAQGLTSNVVGTAEGTVGTVGL